MLLRIVLVMAAMCMGPFAFANDRDQAKSRLPNVIEWQGHYLTLQGENFLPIKRGLATPNITIFTLEEGYMPSGKATLDTAIEGCGPGDRAGQSVTSTGAASSQRQAEAAADYASAETARARQRQYCPEGLGKVYSTGSYVYDGDFNDLAGQDFDDGTETWRGWFLFGEKEEPQDILIVGQGGAKRAGDPALEIYNYDNGMIVDVLFDPNTANGRQAPGLGDSGTAPAPELPVTVTFNGWFKETVKIGDDGFTDLGQVEAALERALSKATEKAAQGQDVLIVSRGATPDTFEANEKRLKVITNTVRKRVGQGSRISVVSLGLAAPVCNDDDPACRVLNRSTIMYVRPK